MPVTRITRRRVCLPSPAIKCGDTCPLVTPICATPPREAEPATMPTGVLTQLEIEPQARYISQPWRGLSRRTLANLSGRRLKLRRANPIWQQSVPTITLLPKRIELASAQEFARRANEAGITWPPDQQSFTQDAVPALGDIQGPGSNSSTAIQPASVATGHPLPATGDMPMSPSSHDCPPEATGVISSTDSPATHASPPPSPDTEVSPPCKRRKIEPVNMLAQANADYAERSTDAHPAGQPIVTVRSSPVKNIQRVCVAQPKYDHLLPRTLPHRPTKGKFPAFSWGPYHIYHGGQRAAYRVMDTRIGRNTKLFKHWGDLCTHIISGNE